MAAERTSVPCPGCGAALIALTEGASVMGGCPQCGGMWLNNVASQQLMNASLSEHAREFVRLITTRIAAPSGDPYRGAAANTRMCPVCGQALAPVKLQTPAATIDVCTTHGAFMDRGEVGAIWAEMSVQAAAVIVANDRRAADAAWAATQASFNVAVMSHGHRF